jgi:hypothetical protein
MANIHFTTLQDILEEAGLASDVHGETPAGVVDNANKLFTVPNKPLTDANYDDKVDKDDVQIYFDGVPAAVSSVNEQFGTITTVEAPAEDVEVTIDYRYSAITMRFLANLRDEAEATINTRMRSVDSCAPYGIDGAEVPKKISGIARRIAAGWLLTRDYGFNQDIEGTSKDGYKKLEVAEQELETYAKSGGNCGVDGSGSPGGGDDAVSTSSDGNLFPEPHFDNIRRRSEDY